MRGTVKRHPFASVGAAVAAAVAFAAIAHADPFDISHAKVGRQADGSIVTSTNQRLTPAGVQVELAGRPTAIALQPGGRTAAVLRGAGGSALAVIDVVDGTIVQEFDPGGGGGSYDGLAYAPDGSKLYASEAGGSLVIASVAPDGSLTTDAVIALPQTSGNPYPGGLAVNEAGTTVYVALSRNNALGVFDVATRTLRAEIPVGNAPHSVILDGDRAYVSNEGGRPASADDFTNDSAGTPIVADPDRGSAITGTVSVVDLEAESEVGTVEVGLHPTAMLLDHKRLFVANTNSDTVSVIDTVRNVVESTIAVAPFPEAPYGSGPNALVMLDRHRLAVSLGRDNAVAVYDWRGPREPARFEGLLPTGWYPGALALGPDGDSIVVANVKGVGSLGPERAADPLAGNSGKYVHANRGSLSLIPIPDAKTLHHGLVQVFENNGWDHLDTAAAREGVEPVAIPVHVGEPSLIEHVVLIVKENRTYDQVLGDDSRGDGDPSLTQFGTAVTPNQHALATQFPLLDNFYASGSLSADGHQWVVQALAPDYLEKAFGSFVRSYPYNGGDALAYGPTGFLWENALAHGKSVEVYGEYSNGKGDDGMTHSDIPSLDRVLDRTYPPYDLSIPDVSKAQMFLGDLQQFEDAGAMPNLMIVQLPNDHTTATLPSYPSPNAQVSDNDMGVGMVVQGLSESAFWPKTAVFVVEDDAQAGLDHVDGHRTTAFVASPYAKPGVDSTYYTQVNMVRTIEQILGLPPMNQMDLAATPMTAAFTNTPNLAPFTAIASLVPVTYNPPLDQLTGAERAWAEAATHWDFTTPDAVDRGLMKRAIYYAVTGFTRPYPGDDRILLPDEVAREELDEAEGE